jgi:hypothetical protein
MTGLANQLRKIWAEPSASLSIAMICDVTDHGLFMGDTMKRVIVLLGFFGLTACEQAKICRVPAHASSNWDGKMDGPGAVIVFQSRMTGELQSCLKSAAYRFAMTGEPVGVVAEAALGKCDLDLQFYAQAVRSRFFRLDYQTSFEQDMAVLRQAEVEGRRFAIQAALNGRLDGCDIGSKVVEM